jgi:putative transposase
MICHPAVDPSGSMRGRKDNIKLSLTRQCKLLKISRSSIYYIPVGVNAETLALMHEIDRVFTKYPFFGSRQIAAYLPQSGFSAGRHRVRRLMNLMGLQAIYKGPNTSKKHPQHRIYPYLLRKLAITRPNQVWCSDITYIPVKSGFLYLVAIMDWATRKVLTWRLSNTLDASFCVEALEEAIARYGKPEIMNTDQGSQYTGTGWITTLIKADIKISMPLGDFTNHLPVIDGRGRYLDNIFIERLWRSLKQEAVYLHQITDGFQAKRIIDNWIGFDNSERPHTALDKRTPETPDIAYLGNMETRKAA